MKIVAAGATGFIGRALVPALTRAGHEVVILSRRPGASGLTSAGAREVEWDGRSLARSWVGEIDGAQSVINLAGVNIGGGLWTTSRRRAIIDSRTASTGALVKAIEGLLPTVARSRSSMPPVSAITVTEATKSCPTMPDLAPGSWQTPALSGRSRPLRPRNLGCGLS